MLHHAQTILKDTFGYNSFREGQDEILERILQKKDTVGIMPTGGGKSLCYQIPAMIFSGVTLVVSPLISLMKDQVDALNQEGVSATFINSSLSTGEVRERLKGAANGQYKLIYVAPERLESPSFSQLLHRLPISLIAIDEAHCISQWGHDFRPSYLSIQQMITRLENRPVIIALTATATPEVADDICEMLQIDEESVVTTGFGRSNLSFRVIKGQNRDTFLEAYIKRNESQSGIIYAATRKEVERIFTRLQKIGLPVGKYHAGMSEDERDLNQEQFLYDDVTIMVATSAFGMGINKSNVRYVVHYHLPKNIEAYYQEAGRAGRDGVDSECVLMYAPQDVRLPKFFIEESDMDPERKTYEYEKLQQMVGYCHTESCLQQYILKYFGEQADGCGRCSNCTDDRQSVDITREAQMVFSCIKRMKERFGKTVIAKVLTGSSDSKVKQFRFDQISTYGIMKDQTQKHVIELIDFLTAEEYLSPTNGSYPVLTLTKKAAEVILGKQDVLKKEQIQAEQLFVGGELFDRLRMLRKNLAEAEKVPPFVIFSDATLREMCAQLPASEEALLQVKGVGQRKLELYGSDFLNEIAASSQANDVS
ncbi:DNA helicase RecQ [Pseudalkalibacillus decolorationis]|uniref:DNA helicase RecQ n=1 Tax=Pseudalkalibacillus decolorationis TaxID=163879 RepID=UPI0021473343|nr:DNA helicase RecQ [Pseudalkalibacillus decolorationis]